MNATTLDDTNKKEYFKNISKHCSKYKDPKITSSLIQLSLTLLLFLTTCYLLALSVKNGFWLGYVALLLPASGLLVKMFIIQHDCGHGSYFKSTKLNDNLGRFVSLFTWTPYYYWKKMHNIHHAGSGNLERRGYGGIETLTVSEYNHLERKDKIKYRLYRNPFFLLLFGTPFFMIIMQRFSMVQPLILPEGSKKLSFKGGHIPKSVWGTNISLFILYGSIGYFIGYTALIAAYLPILLITCFLGGWLFYVQHQFEDAHWEHQENWSHSEAAIMGSSYYKLPQLLQWFTGNIGIHHVHHLNSSIPNYRLQECIDSLPELKTINVMTIKDSLKCVKFALWDDKTKKMVSFAAAN